MLLLKKNYLLKNGSFSRCKDEVGGTCGTNGREEERV
jgi:hypothetical protein